jgi:hypothetical protein
MKHYIQILNLLFILVASLIETGCSQKVYPTAKVNYLSGNSETITMRAIGMGIDRYAAITNAELNAIDVVLFRGLPESEQKTALVGSNEAEERSKNEKYFSEFYDNKRYKTFVMSSISVSNLVRITRREKNITVDVKINITALRKDLEQFNIIRKFGY